MPVVDEMEMAMRQRGEPRVPGDAPSPYRQGRVRDLCQHRIALPVPEIESDGSEVRERRCEGVAVDTCARCGRLACEAHRPAAGGRCQECESELDRALARIPAPVLSRRETIARVQMAVGCMVAAMGLLFGALAIGAPGWVVVALPVSVHALGVHIAWTVRADRLARYRRERARRRFLGELPPPGHG
ncbi:MAG TPA: hypothetical protein VKB80_33885 [Kofleriaceae bacterium]|nr:hypothetical protein [Kofleriaceae bacterium]